MVHGNFREGAMLVVPDNMSGRMAFPEVGRESRWQRGEHVLFLISYRLRGPDWLAAPCCAQRRPSVAALHPPATCMLAGTTYRDFIASLHLPNQLADVDPIVASFCGGAVGVLSALLLVEINNAKVHNKQRCLYCEVRGRGWAPSLPCMGVHCGNCCPCAWMEVQLGGCTRTSQFLCSFANILLELCACHVCFKCSSHGHANPNPLGPCRGQGT